MKTYSAAEIQALYHSGIRVIADRFENDLVAVMDACRQRHRAGAKRMKTPTLSVWADADDCGNVSICVRFDPKGKGKHPSAIKHTFPGATYKDVADMVGKMRPLLCSIDTVGWLVQSGRPRMLAKLSGGVA